MREKIKTAISRGMKVRMFELDMTERELARKSGVVYKSISNYVNKRNVMNADALAAVAVALECSADWLLGLKEERK